MSDKNQESNAEFAANEPRLVVPESMAELSRNLTCELRDARQHSKTPGSLVEMVLARHRLSMTNLDSEVLTDIVYAEWMLRLEQGESPSPGEYQTRFPKIWHLLERQLQLEESLSEIGEGSTQNDVFLTTYVFRPGEESPEPPQPERDFIGKYKLISKLGSGGQADVYRALHPGLDRDVVIKVVRPRWQPDLPNDTIQPPDHLMAAMGEARLLAQIMHPNIARIFDVDQENGLPFLVMEYVEGLSLDQYHRTHSLSWQELAALLSRVARAVAAAHKDGIVHRDIKPQNIVVRRDGEPVLIDFGLAQLNDVWNQQEQLPGISGTLGFMSPEQARGDVAEVGPATDVFALGAVLYFLLTGQSPYHGSSTLTGVNLYAILERAKRCEWDREALSAPELPADLVRICTRAMASRPSERFATANQFAEALEEFATSQKPKPRTAVLISTVVLTIGAVTASIYVFYNSSKSGAEPKGDLEVPVFVQSQASRLSIRIHREPATLDLIDAVPLLQGESLSVLLQIPASVSLSFYSINGAGELRHVATVKSQNVDHAWRYPEGTEKAVPLVGATGTECLLCIGRTGTSSDVDQIQQTWGAQVKWPGLPDSTVLRIMGRKVTVEQRGRDLGSPIDSGLTATDQVIQTLERFVGALDSQCVFIEGLVFCHADAE